MTTISEFAFPASTTRFAGFAPVFLQDQDTPKTKPKEDGKDKKAKKDGKGKTDKKGKKSKTRKLTDLELEAIKRIAALNSGLAAKLRRKLPKKLTPDEIKAYLGKKLVSIDEDSNEWEEFKKNKFADKKGIDKKLERNKRVREDIFDILDFIEFGVIPDWYKKILKKRKKAQKKQEGKSPTSKPASKPSKKPGDRPVPKRPDDRDGFNGTFPGAVLINFA